MALLPQRLSDGFVELRRCGFVDLESAVDAIHESWSELHHWLVSFQEEVTQDSYVRVIDDYVRGFDEDQDWSYFVVDQDDAALVGVANLYRLSGPERVAIGYWVRTSRTRRGYASRASRLLVDSAFSCLPMVNIVEIQMDVTNLASVRVAEKLGFRCVSEIKREIMAPGQSGRGFIWEMDRATWTSSNPAVPSILAD